MAQLIALITTMSAASASVEGIKRRLEIPMKVRSLQAYHQLKN